MNFTNSLRTRHLRSASTRLSSLLSTRRTSKTCSPGIFFSLLETKINIQKKIYFSLHSLFPNVSNYFATYHLMLQIFVCYLIKLVRGVKRGRGGGGFSLSPRLKRPPKARWFLYVGGGGILLRAPKKFSGQLCCNHYITA